MTIQSEIQALKCADCARSDSAVSDLRPDSLLPIPADALAGWREGRPGTSGVTRRNLGWRFWYGNPVASTTLVTASKPAAGAVG